MTKTTEQAIWGGHAGCTGEAHSLFVNHKVIALGWPKMGDLSALAANREAFKAKVRRLVQMRR